MRPNLQRRGAVRERGSAKRGFENAGATAATDELREGTRGDEELGKLGDRGSIRLATGERGGVRAARGGEMGRNVVGVGVRARRVDAEGIGG